MALLDEEKTTVNYVNMDKKQRKKSREISMSFKIFLTTWAFVENGLFSGLRAGWSAMVYILKQKRVYAYLCNDVDTGNTSSLSTTAQVSYETVLSTVSYNSSNQSTLTTSSDCNDQDAMFNQCFTVASATMALSALLYGHLNYKYGIRAPRILSVVMFVGGAVCFAFVDEGLLLISSGGMALYITNNQISYMFTTGSAAVVGLLCGALEASAIVQSIIKILFENGISIFISYLTLGGLYTLTLISTIFFLPKDYVRTEREADISKDSDRVTDDESDDNQETVPITRSSEVINSDKRGSKNISVKRNGKLTDTEHISDLVDTNNRSQNGNGICRDEADAESAEQTSDEKYQQILSNTADLSTYGSTLDNQNINNVEDIESIENDLSERNNITAKDESVEHIQNTEVTTIIPSTKNKSNINGENKMVDATESKKSLPSDNGKVIEKSLMKCLLTKTFILYLFWAAAVQIILSMSLGTFNPWLDYVTNKDSAKVSELTDVLFYTMLGSPILALAFGVAMDLLKRPRPNDTTPAEVRILHTSTVSLALTSLLGVLLCGLIMTCNNNAVIGTSIILVVFRTGLYSCGTAFLRIMYPTQYFGILCGIMSVLSGGISYVQYPLFLWVQYRNQAWVEVFGFVGIIGILSLVQPAYLYYKSRVFMKESLSGRKKVTNGLNVESPNVQEIA